MEEVVGVFVNESSVRPRVSCARLLLTYKTHLNKDDYITWFKSGFIKFLDEDSLIRLAHEKGDTGYNHTHVLIEFNKDKLKNHRFDVSRCFDYTIMTETHFINALKYMCKEDKENLDLLDVADDKNKTVKKTKKEMTEDDYNSIALCKTEFDAIKLASKFKVNATNAIAIWRAAKSFRDEKNKIARDLEPLRGWQTKVEELLKRKPSERKVYWFYDEKGGKGKSYLVKYLTNKYSNCIAVSNMKLANMQHLIGNKMEENPQINCVLFDLARSAIICNDIYECIENIKNGKIDIEKYMTKQVMFNPCHVIVLSNSKPNRKMLSADRWCVYDISKLEQFEIDEEDELKFDDDNIVKVSDDEDDVMDEYISNSDYEEI
nr:MAG: replication associated protein [Arizlama virus]